MKMETIIVLASVLVAISAIQPADVNGNTPPAIDCPNYLCNGKQDGNYELSYHSNYFLQCLGGVAYCQACWPLSLVFVGRCNQCLYSRSDKCVTTTKWEPATTFDCPDICRHYGPDFSGNMLDYYNSRHYVACWKGVTLGCVACPSGLEFNEKENACLYQGRYFTKPLHY